MRLYFIWGLGNFCDWHVMYWTFLFIQTATKKLFDLLVSKLDSQVDPPLSEQRVNLDFYQNKVPSRPDGDFIDNILDKWK